MIDDIHEAIWRNELSDWLPPRLCDVHSHVWNDALGGAARRKPTVTLADLAVWDERLWPGRAVSRLAFPDPEPGMLVEAHNFWLADQLDLLGGGRTRGALLVGPETRAGEVRRLVREHPFAGLKPYFSLCRRGKEARVAEYLPAEALEVADEFGLVVVLHLARAGVVDDVNVADLEQLAAAYPSVRWLLAHVGACRMGPAVGLALPRLAALPNLWWDTSAVTDVIALWTIFKGERPERVCWGTDNVVAGGRRPDPARAVVAYEQLLATKKAMGMAGWGEAEERNHFWESGERLLRGGPA